MALFWLRVALALYGLGLLYALVALVRRKEIMPRVMMPVVGLGTLFHLVSWTEVAMSGGHLGDVIAAQYPSLLGLLLMVVFFAIYWRYRITSHGIFVFPVVFLLALS